MPLFDEEYLETFYRKKKKSKLIIVKKYLERLFQIFSLKKSELIIIEKELFPWVPFPIEALLSKLGFKYIVDYDDAIFHKYDLHKNYVIRKLLSNKINSIMKSSSACICGNAYLEKKALKSGAKLTKYIPTVVDIERYTSKKNYALSEKIVIGWVGSPSTSRYLESLRNIFKKLSTEYQFKLVVVGADFECDEVEVENIPWSEDSEAKTIIDFDVGIMPLLDSPWEKGKCGYKLIQYMASGVPVIASDIGVNKSIVEDSGSGFVVDSEVSWLNAFRNLFDSEALRAKKGINGRKSVERKFSVQVQSLVYRELIDEVKIKMS